MSESVQNGTSSPCRLMSQTVGFDGGSVPCCSAEPALHGTISVMDQEPEQHSALQNYGDTQRFSCSKAVEEIPISSGRRMLWPTDGPEPVWMLSPIRLLPVVLL